MNDTAVAEKLVLVKDLPSGVLPFDVFDRKGSLMFSKGSEIEPGKVEKLLEIGTFRKIADIKLPFDSSSENDPKKSDIPKPKGELIHQFPEGCINISDTINLEASDGAKYSVKVLGRYLKEGILTSIPKIDDKFVAVRESNVYQAKYFNGEDIYNFNVEVIDIIWSPIPILVLKYPKQISRIKVRGSKRIDVAIIGTISDYSESRSCKIVNLSEGGALIESRAFSCELGDQLELSFPIELEGEKQLVTFKAECTRSEKTPEGVNSIGMRFENNQLITKVFLKLYLKTI